MKNNYIVNRNQVYIGRIVKTCEIKTLKDNLYPNREIKVVTSKNDLHRVTLFKIDNNFSKDLLYKSPNYPIYSISKEDDILNSEIVIEKMYNLSKLLKYLGYQNKLTVKDIKNIKKQIINIRYLYNNNLPNNIKNILYCIESRILNDALEYKGKKNIFKPDKNEEKIKILSI